jgi:hypothetical protein
LKLKGGALAQGEEEGTDADTFTLAGSVRSGTGKNGGEKEVAVGGLDPLHEHDDEHGDHGIMPVKKEG